MQVWGLLMEGVTPVCVCVGVLYAHDLLTPHPLHKINPFQQGPLPGGLSVRGLSGGEKRRLSLVRACVRGDGC